MDNTRTFPILDAINDTLHGRQLTSRRVMSPIVTSSLVGTKCRIVSARDIRCGRGLNGDAVRSNSQTARGCDDDTVTSRPVVGRNGCVVSGNGKQRCDGELNCGNESSADDDDEDLDDDIMSMPWDMMSRWCRYAALSKLLKMWSVFTVT